MRGGRTRHGFDRRGDLLDPVHAEDIGAPQPHDLGHADLRAARLELQGDPVEQRSGIDGAHEADVEQELVAREAIDEDQRDMRVGTHIRRRLGEELVGEGDMLLIDPYHMGQVGNVRHAIGRSGGDDGGDDALEAGGEVAEAYRHQDLAPASMPASGPGVWT